MRHLLGWIVALDPPFDKFRPFDKLRASGCRNSCPFVLSLSKHEAGQGTSWFDKLTTNGRGIRSW